MKRIFLNISIILVCIPAVSQKAKISEEFISLPTYLYSLPDPVPQPGRIYPYFRFDGYTADPIDKEWKMIKLENDFIEVYITPEIGGKIWGAIEKSTGNEFIYFNHSVKFRDIAMRGPWTSGGIEMNFGLIGHAPTCSSPVDYYLHEYNDGSVSCFLGAMDLPSRTEWRVEVRLHPDRSYFTTHALWFNPSGAEQSYYHWMNGAVKAEGNLEFAYPGTAFIGHDGTSSPWPVDSEKRQLAFYDNNDFGSYKSYHVLGEYTNFFGGYWHDDHFGFGRYSNYDDKPGKKIWIWGLSRQGMIWEDLLTDSDGQYVEIQSGRLFNQEAASSTYTPFKHRGFPPYSADIWTEYWFPVIGTKGVDRAIPEASVNIEQIDDSLHSWICSNVYLHDTIAIYSDSDMLFIQRLSLKPTDVTHIKIPYSGLTENISVKIGNQYVIGPGGTSHHELSRPLQSPEFDWNSTYGLYLMGKEKYRQRLYEEAGRYYQKCLEKELNYLPALTGLAQVKLKQLEPHIAWELLQKALAIDTYDPEANYYYGIASLHTDRFMDAKDGFSIASASLKYRTGSYTELAKIYFREGDYRKALEYAQKSMIYNRFNIPGLEIMALTYRKMGLYDDATATLIRLLNIDPLNHFSRFEMYGTKEAEPDAIYGFTGLIRNELPHETFLETAIKYYRLECLKEAMSVLELAPDHPMIKYWLAFLSFHTGNISRSKQYLDEADMLSPNLVFPFRDESIDVLQWAAESSESWKPTYYLGLIYWNKGQVNKTKSLFMNCGDAPDFAAFYLARGDLFQKEKGDLSIKSFQKAMTLDPESWKPGYLTIQYLSNQGELNVARSLARQYFSKHPDNYYLGLQLAGLLNQMHEFDPCIQILRNLEVLPNEGATSGRVVWREANLRKAVQLLISNDFTGAEKHIHLALKWPENLGVGKPYTVDQRLEDFLLLLIFRQTDETNEMRNAQQRIVNFPSSSDVIPEDFIKAWVLRNMDRTKEADILMEKFTGMEKSNVMTQWCHAIYSGDQKLATDILTNYGFYSEKNRNFVLDLLVQIIDNSDYLLPEFNLKQFETK